MTIRYFLIFFSLKELFTKARSFPRRIFFSCSNKHLYFCAQRCLFGWPKSNCYKKLFVHLFGWSSLLSFRISFLIWFQLVHLPHSSYLRHIAFCMKMDWMKNKTISIYFTFTSNNEIKIHTCLCYIIIIIIITLTCLLYTLEIFKLDIRFTCTLLCK